MSYDWLATASKLLQDAACSHLDASLVSHTIIVRVYTCSRRVQVCWYIAVCMCGCKFDFHIVYLPGLFEDPLAQQKTVFCTIYIHNSILCWIKWPSSRLS